MISSLTQRNEGVYFTSQSFGLRYMERLANGKYKNEEMTGFGLNGGFYLNPQEGIDVFSGKFQKNEFDRAWNYTKLNNGTLNINGIDFNVMFHIHNHHSKETFSGIDPSDGSIVEGHCLWGCDISTFYRNFLKKGGVSNFAIMKIFEKVEIDILRINRESNTYSYEKKGSIKKYYKKNLVF